MGHKRRNWKGRLKVRLGNYTDEQNEDVHGQRQSDCHRWENVEISRPSRTDWGLLKERKSPSSRREKIEPLHEDKTRRGEDDVSAVGPIDNTLR